MSQPATSLATAGRSTPADLPAFSPWIYRWFVHYLRGYFGRNFNAVRTSRALAEPLDDGRPLIVYTNHPSWWDPIHCLLLASVALPRRRVFGPMDAAALEKYRFFKRIGAFGIERDRRGAATFVRVGLAVLARPDASLWLTAEGQFNDIRPRPIHLRPGLAHLVRRVETARVIPLAVEYPFWNERRPEALSRFGPPIDVGPGERRSLAEWTALFERRLAETMDALAQDAQARDGQRFETVVSGRAGVGPVYDGWRRVKALARGRRFSAAHMGEAP